MSETLSKKQKNYNLDMTSGPILVNLLKFSIPLILSSILQLLFNAADIVVVGRFAGDASLAAVGSTSSLINLLVNLFIGLSVGTNVVAANFFGANKKNELRTTIHTAILLSIYSGLILTIVGIFGAKHILTLMQTPEDVLPLATIYLQVYFAGMIAMMVYNFGSAILRAKGDTKRPLYYLLFSGVINVILNLFFVITFKMGVAGVALATVISTAIAALLVVRCLMNESEEFKLVLSELKLDYNILIKIIKIGVPAGLQGIVFSLSNVVIQSAINSFGAIIVAGNSAALNIEGFVYTAMNGFAQGTLTFTSQNLGARRHDRNRKAVPIAIGCAFVIGTTLGGLIAVFGNFFLGLFTKSPEVIEVGVRRLYIIGFTYALCGIMDVTANAIRGLGHSVLPMVVTLVGACGIRLVWLATIFQIPQLHNPTTIYISYPVSWLATFITLLISFIIFMNRFNCNNSAE
ncbi:MAG: MATE family efflux transporter [Spirochaetaceae bacterium]|nr:MATE family efflux transporter [Spirochaetaceae bacterium]